MKKIFSREKANEAKEKKRDKKKLAGNKNEREKNSDIGTGLDASQYIWCPFFCHFAPPPFPTNKMLFPLLFILSFFSLCVCDTNTTCPSDLVGYNCKEVTVVNNCTEIHTVFNSSSWDKSCAADLAKCSPGSSGISNTIFVAIAFLDVKADVNDVGVLDGYISSCTSSLSAGGQAMIAILVIAVIGAGKRRVKRIVFIYLVSQSLQPFSYFSCWWCCVCRHQETSKIFCCCCLRPKINVMIQFLFSFDSRCF